VTNGGLGFSRVMVVDGSRPGKEILIVGSMRQPPTHASVKLPLMCPSLRVKLGNLVVAQRVPALAVQRSRGDAPPYINTALRNATTAINPLFCYFPLERNLPRTQ
jgi:hypothetical protein